MGHVARNVDLDLDLGVFVSLSLLFVSSKVFAGGEGGKNL